MPFFRRKPITVWAEQWFPDHPVEGVLYPVPDDGADISFHRLHGEDCGLLLTAEGVHVIVSAGDWIITGAAGEHYSCRQDLFERTYEVAKGG